MSELPRVFLADHLKGKTTQLVQWLLQGEPRASWPSWSRVLLVATVRDVHNVVAQHQEANQVLRTKDGPALSKIVLCAERDAYAVHTRLRLQDVEVALDDADRWLRAQLGFMPALMSMTAKPLTSSLYQFRDLTDEELKTNFDAALKSGDWGTFIISDTPVQITPTESEEAP
jgi:hypothetical protein